MDRYKNYIPFNENIITNETTNFYDNKESLIYNVKTDSSVEMISSEDAGYAFVSLKSELDFAAAATPQEALKAYQKHPLHRYPLPCLHPSAQKALL